MEEAEDDLILALYFYLDVLVDFQGDTLDRRYVDMDTQVPPVPGLLMFVFGEVVAQVDARIGPRKRRHDRELQC